MWNQSTQDLTNKTGEFTNNKLNDIKCTQSARQNVGFQEQNADRLCLLCPKITGSPYFPVIKHQIFWIAQQLWLITDALNSDWYVIRVSFEKWEAMDASEKWQVQRDEHMHPMSTIKVFWAPEPQLVQRWYTNSHQCITDLPWGSFSLWTSPFWRGKPPQPRAIYMPQTTPLQQAMNSTRWVQIAAEPWTS